MAVLLFDAALPAAAMPFVTLTLPAGPAGSIATPQRKPAWSAICARLYVPDWNSAIRPDRNWLREKSPLWLVSDAGGDTWSVLMRSTRYVNAVAAAGLSKANLSCRRMCRRPIRCS